MTSRARLRLLAPVIAIALVALPALPATASAADAWLAHSEISPVFPSTNYLRGSDAAMSESGDSLVAWNNGAGPEKVYTYSARFRPAGGAWTNESIGSGLFGSSYMDVDLNDGGQGVAAWIGPAANACCGSQLMASVRRPDGTWTTPVVLEGSGKVAAPATPDALVDDAGNVTVVWRGGDTDSIRSARWSAATQMWGATETAAPAAGALGGTADTDHSPFAADLDGAGRVVVVFPSYPSGGMKSLMVVERAAGGSWSTPQAVYTGDSSTESIETVRLDVSRDGTAMAAFHEHRAFTSQARVQGAARNAGSSTWALSEVALADGNGVSHRALRAAAANGAGAVMWGDDNHPTSGDDWTSLADWKAATGWGSSAQFSTVVGYADSIAINSFAMNARGDAIAIHDRYRQNEGKSLTAYVRRAGQSTWTTTTVRFLADVYFNRATVELDAEGNALATWIRNIGTNTYTMEAAGFDGAGPRLSNFNAPDGVTNHPTHFSVDAVDVWSPPAAVQWAFGGSEGTANGATVSHTYTSQGTYTVQATATDGLGNTSTRSRAIEIGAPGPKWLSAENLTANVVPTTNFSLGTATDMDGRGNSLAAWVGYVGGQKRVFASKRDAGGPWQAPQEVAVALGVAPNTLSVELADDGSGAIAWQGADPGGCCATFPYVVHRASNGTWGAVQELVGGQHGRGASRRPFVGFDRDGNLSAVWSQSGDIYTATRAATTGIWGTAVLLGQGGFADGGPNAYDIDVAPNGATAVVWVNHDVVTGGHPAGTGRVRVATRAAAGPEWSVSTVYASSSGDSHRSDTYYPNVEVAPTGAVLVAWREDRYSPTSPSYWHYDHNWRAASRAAGSGAWSEPVDLSPQKPGQGNHLHMTSDGSGSEVVPIAMEMDGDGRATALWGRFMADAPRLETRDFDPATGWTEASNLWAGGSYQFGLFRPSIAMNEDGDAVVAFGVHGAQYGWNTDFSVLGASREAGGAWTTPTAVITETNIPHFFVTTGIDEQGNGVVGWSRDAGEYDRRPQAAGFDGSGPRMRSFVAPDGEPGQELQFGIEAVDVWSPPTTTPHWTFGPGQGTADENAPRHTYVDPGTYPVSVEATDARGMTSTRSRSVQIAANQKPVAAFTITPNPALTGQTVTFDATTATDADGAVSQYSWDLDGDGTYDDFAAAEEVTATYSEDGTVTVGLKVKDDDGAISDAVTHTLTVNNRVPTLGVSALAVSPTTAATGETVTFTATGAADDDGTIAGYEWDLDGDAGNGYEHYTTGASTTRSYMKSGARNVRVRAVDDDGGRSQAAASTVTITNRAPTAIISPTETQVQVGDDVVFNGAGSSDPDGTVDGYEWDLDGDPATGADGFETATDAGAKSHTFTAIGDQVVRLRVRDDEGLASAPVTAAIEVVAAPVAPNAKPSARLSVAPNPVLTGDGVTFSGDGSSDSDGRISAYEWDLDGDAGNGYERTTTESSVTRTYDTAGAREIRLRVIDNRGERSDSVSSTLVVDARPREDDPAPPPRPPDHVVTKQASGVTVVSAKRVRKIPNVVGRNVDDARDILDRSHYIDYEIDWVHRTGRDNARIGDVVGQDPDGGDREDSGPADLLKMELKVYAGPRKTGDACPAGMKAALRSADLDLGRALLEETKCEVVEVNYSPNGKADETEIGGVKIVNGGDGMVQNVTTPTQTEHQGLFLIVRGWRKKGHQQLDEQWRIVTDSDQKSCFSVQVIDRSRSLVANAVVTVDASDAGGEDVSDATDEKGRAVLCGMFKNGLPQTTGVDVVARAEGQNGHALNGMTRLRVKAYNAVKTYKNTVGQTIDRKTASAVPAARAANLVDFLANAWNVVSQLGQQTATFFTDVADGMRAKADGIAAAIREGWPQAANAPHYAAPGNLNPGGLLTGAAGVIAAGGGNVIAAGGGNVIAAGGGNVIAAGGGNVIAAGGGNVIAAGGGNVIAAGGGNVIAAGGGNVIAAGGGNVIAAGGGNVIAAGGGNVIAPGGGNVIAAGGGNVIAAGGGNFAGGGARARAAGGPTARAAQEEGSGWLVRSTAQVLSVPPKGAIVTSTWGEVLWGGGHFTSADHGGDVKDAKTSNVVQPDKETMPDVWALQRIE